MSRWQILEGDALERLREMEPESIDAIVTDPPYVPCADCPTRFCEGGCGQMASECECDPDDEYPPAPASDLGYELANPEPEGLTDAERDHAFRCFAEAGRRVAGKPPMESLKR